MTVLREVKHLNKYIKLDSIKDDTSINEDKTPVCKNKQFLSKSPHYQHDYNKQLAFES